jgi:hypothetical protein
MIQSREETIERLKTDLQRHERQRNEWEALAEQASARTGAHVGPFATSH